MTETEDTGTDESGPAAGREIVIATLMRRDSHDGVRTHITHVASMLDVGRPRCGTVVTPFSSRSLTLRPVFAVRLLVAPFSGSADVWWYRRWHAHYLTAALRHRLRRAAPDATVYAQRPLSADAALRTRRVGQRVVMATHFNVSQADEWVEKGRIARDGRLYDAIRRFESETLPRLDGIVYVSDYMRGVLEDRLPVLRAVPSVVVPNFLLPVDAPAPDASGGPGGDLITVGSLEPRKNHAYLLEVLRAASDRGYRYRLTLVGDGPLRRSLEKAARRLGLADQVTFLGYRANARSLMAAHRLDCHTAIIENLPFSIVEAMSEGLPVLAAPVGRCPGDAPAGRRRRVLAARRPGRRGRRAHKDHGGRAETPGDGRRGAPGGGTPAVRRPGRRRLLRFLVEDDRGLAAPVGDR